MTTATDMKALVARAVEIAEDGCEGPFDENCHEYPDKVRDWCAPCVLEELAKVEALSSSASSETPDLPNEALVEPPGRVQIQAGSELRRLIELVRLKTTDGAWLHPQFEANQLLWRWFLKWRTVPETRLTSAHSSAVTHEADPGTVTCLDCGARVRVGESCPNCGLGE